MTAEVIRNVPTLDSREVAEMTGKLHKNLLRDIDGYVEILLGSKLSPDKFFSKSSYLDLNNQERPCYLLTKMGCDMVANKLTGEKGVLFTAEYVQKFHDMENSVPQIDNSSLSPELRAFGEIYRSMARTELEQKRLSKKVDGITEVVSLNSSNWRQDTQRLINKIALKNGGTDAFKDVRTAIYKEVDRRGRFDLERRLTNKRQRMAYEGASKSEQDNLSKVNVIADDRRLIEVYLAVVKDFAIKYGVEV